MTAATQLDMPFASRLERRFWAFHQANPHVYREIERRALAVHRARPRLKFGIALVYEAIRYDAAVTTEGEVWKLNQDYRSRYARLLVEKRPELRGYVRMRELKS